MGSDNSKEIAEELTETRFVLKDYLNLLKGKSIKEIISKNSEENAFKSSKIKETT